MAIHLACRSLHDGESDLAAAGGVAVALEPAQVRRRLAAGHAVAERPLPHVRRRRRRFVSGEGVVVFILKRLPDAERDGDRILAIVSGTAANQDGRTPNIATPSEDAQVEVYQAALAAGGIDPASIGFVEAHGTGTPVGDPIEYASLAAVYGTGGPTVLGSAKTNFGHLQSTSGPLGMMKAILALQHGVVPKNLHFNRLPEEIASIDTGLFVPGEPRRGRTTATAAPRRRLVYGMSGTNAHAVLERRPQRRRTGRRGERRVAAAAVSASATSVEQLR